MSARKKSKCGVSCIQRNHGHPLGLRGDLASAARARCYTPRRSASSGDLAALAPPPTGDEDFSTITAVYDGAGSAVAMDKAVPTDERTQHPVSLRYVGYTTIIGKNQVSIPMKGMRALGWQEGDQLLVEVAPASISAI